MARGLRPSTEIAITRSTSLSAASSLGAAGTTVFSAEGKTGDGEGETSMGTVSLDGGVARHPAARNATAIKMAGNDVRRRRTVMSLTLTVSRLGGNVARLPVVSDYLGKAPVSAGPREAASPVTNRTRSAVAAARAGKSHHGVGKRCRDCRPCRRSSALAPCSASRASPRAAPAGTCTSARARSAAITASQLAAKVNNQP